LITLCIGALPTSRLATATLALAALYFAGTFRHHYFREWSINANIRETIPILEAESRRLNTREIISDLNYTPSLNVYRLLNNTSAFDVVANHDHPLPAKSIYVIPADQHADFIRQEGLTLRYRSPLSDYSIYIQEKNLKAESHQ
jgi:hypothetical protein